MKTLLSYRDYLNYLTEHPQSSSWDYSLYMQQIDEMGLFARQSSTVPFILDYSLKNYPFMGKNIREITNYSNDAFYEGGLEFVLHNNPDFRVLNQEIFRDREEFLATHNTSSAAELRFTMNFRLKGAKGNCHNILQKNTVIYASDLKLPVAILGFVWDVTDQMNEGKFIQKIENLDPKTGLWNVLMSKEYYPKIDKDKLLSKREIEILKWVLEGLNSKQIADKLFLSTHTVITHRRNMLAKTNCLNSMDLLRYAIKHGIL